MVTQDRRRTRLSRSQQDYLKAIYLLRPTGTTRVGTRQLAERLGVAPASVTEMLQKLAGLDLVSYDRYQGVSLTAHGRRGALEMIRHHRVLETYLTTFLGYGWDEVHDEAEHLEHVISERMESRMFDALGRPTEDPHGDPIPSLGGDVSSPKYRALLMCRPGETVTVRRVSDREPDKLRALARLGLELGDRPQVVEQSAYEGPLVLRLGKRRLEVPIGLARIVFVE